MLKSSTADAFSDRDAGEGIHNEPMCWAQQLRATKLKVRRCPVQWMRPGDRKHLLMLRPLPLAADLEEDAGCSFGA